MKAFYNLIFCLVLCLALSQPTAAAVIFSAQNGNWNNPATWSGGNVPGATDEVVIAAHNVNIQANSNYIVWRVTISTGGTLTMAGGGLPSTLTITGNITNEGLMGSGTFNLNSPSSGQQLVRLINSALENSDNLTINAQPDTEFRYEAAGQQLARGANVSYYNLSLSGGNKFCTGVGSNITVNGNLEFIDSSTLNLGEYSLTLAGNILNGTSGNILQATNDFGQSVTWIVNDNQTIEAGTYNFYRMEIERTNNTSSPGEVIADIQSDITVQRSIDFINNAPSVAANPLRINLNNFDLNFGTNGNTDPCNIGSGVILSTTGTDNFQSLWNAKAVSSDPNATIRFDAPSGTQQLPTQTMFSSMGHLVIGANASVALNQYVICSDFILEGSGSSFVGQTGFTIEVEGNWTNNGGTLTPNGLTVEFTGNTDQNYSSTGSDNFESVRIDKTGGRLILQNDLILSQTLLPVRGELDANGNAITCQSIDARSDFARTLDIRGATVNITGVNNVINFNTLNVGGTAITLETDNLSTWNFTNNSDMLTVRLGDGILNFGNITLPTNAGQFNMIDRNTSNLLTINNITAPSVDATFSITTDSPISFTGNLNIGVTPSWSINLGKAGYAVSFANLNLTGSASFQGNNTFTSDVTFPDNANLFFGRIISGQALTFGQNSFVEFDDQINLNDLTINAGCNVIFQAGVTHIISNTFVVNGASGAEVTISTNISGSVAEIDCQNAQSWTRARVQDINAVDQSITVISGEDLGNNVNVIFATTDYTWVGGTGSWDDPSKWSPTGVPGEGDNAIFNASSFTAAGQTLTINANTIKNVDFSTVTNNPTINFTDILNVRGDFIFSPNLTVTGSGLVGIVAEGGTNQPFTFAGQRVPVFAITEDDNSNMTTAILLDDAYCDDFYLENNADILLNGNNLHIGRDWKTLSATSATIVGSTEQIIFDSNQESIIELPITVPNLVINKTNSSNTVSLADQSYAINVNNSSEITQGTLDLGAGNIGHNLGSVSGSTNGTLLLYNTSGGISFPTSSTFTGNSLWVEFSEGTYSLGLPASYVLPQVRISGTGSKSLNNTGITVNGNFSIASGASFDMGGAFQLVVGGDWTNDGTFTRQSGSTVSFQSGVAQSIGGNNPSSFHNFTLNNTSAGGLVLNQSIELNNTIEITSGKIFLNDYELTLETGASIFPISNPSSDYIVTNGIGSLIYNSLPIGTNTLIPIGTASHYAPIEINLSAAAASAPKFRVGEPGTNGLANLPTPLPSAYVNLVWETQITGTSGDLTLSWSATNEVGTLLATSELNALSGGVWTPLTTNFTAGTQTATANGVSSFNTLAFYLNVSPPTLSTDNVTVSSSNDANLEGNIIADGGDAPTTRGFIYYPFDGSDKIIGDVGVNQIDETGSFTTGTYTLNLSGLTPETHYSTRAFASNVAGDGYGNRIDFWTLSPEPTNHVSDLSSTPVDLTSIELTWTTLPDADGYLLLYGIATDPSTTGIIDGTEPASLSLDATTTLVATLGSVSSHTVTGLASGINYHFTLIPFNWNATNAETYNYLITAPIPIHIATPQPLAPNVLSPNLVNQFDFRANWNTVAGASEYRLDVASDNSFTNFVAGYQDLAVAAPDTFQVVTGLSEATTYYYRVRAIVTSLASGNSATQTTQTLNSAVTAPTAQPAINITQNEFEAVWTTVAGASNYFLDVATDPNFTADSFAPGYENLSVTGTSQVVTGLLDGLTYYYRVRAQVSGQTSLHSNVVLVGTLPDAPNAPLSLTATALSANEVELNWIDNSLNEDGFEIQRSTNAVDFTTIDIVNADVVTYIDNTTLANTSYTYRVRAFNAGGNSAFSSVATVSTLNPPNAPSDLEAIAVSNTSVELNWVDNSSNETVFEIERSDGSLFDFIPVTTVPANTITYTDAGLSPGVQYYYRVRALNTVQGNSDYSNIAGVEAADIPIRPTGLNLNVISANQIDLNWNDNSSNETGFIIEMANPIVNNGLFQVAAEVGVDVNNVSIDTLQPNQPYIFRVRAFNDNGQSPPTLRQTATTLIDPSIPQPDQPFNLIAESVSEGEIALFWEDNSNDETMFVIERSLFPNVGFSVIAQMPANTQNYQDRGLIANVLYYYRIRSANGGGFSAYSNVAFARAECNLVVSVSQDTDLIVEVCRGKEAILSLNTNVIDANYQWTRNGDPIPNANLQIYYANQAGEYNCIVQSGNCLKEAPTPVVVIVTEPFSVDISLDETGLIVPSVSAADGYQWYYNYEPIADGRSERYRPTRSGIYYVLVTEGGCSATSEVLAFENQVTDLSNAALEAKLRLSPNPSFGKTTLQLPQNGLGNYQIRIRDAQGRMYYEQAGKNTSSRLELELNISDLASGIYSLELAIGKYRLYKRLVKY